MDTVKAKFEMTGLPSWMLQPAVRGELNEYSWEKILEAIATGDPLALVLRDLCHLNTKQEYARVLRWIMKDEDRKAEYYLAQEIGTELMADDAMLAADGLDSDGSMSMDDVQRSALRVNTRKWLMSCRNRRRYGDVKQVEQNVTLSIADAMSEADRRLSGAKVIEGEVIK